MLAAFAGYCLVVFFIFGVSGASLMRKVMSFRLSHVVEGGFA